MKSLGSQKWSLFFLHFLQDLPSQVGVVGLGQGKYEGEDSVRSHRKFQVERAFLAQPLIISFAVLAGTYLAQETIDRERLNKKWGVKSCLGRAAI